MPRKCLVIALSGALGCTEPALGDSLVPSAVQLARLAAERGPIRRHLEAAFSSPVVRVTSATLGVSVEEAREDLVGRSDPSASRKRSDTTPKGQIVPPLQVSSTDYRKVLLFAVIFLVATYIVFWIKFSFEDL